MRIRTFIFAALLLASPAAAQVTGTVTDETGNTDITVAIPPFATPADVPNPAGNTAELGRKIAEIMAADLRNADGFSPVGPAGLRSITIGEVTAPAFAEWEGKGAEHLVHGFVRANPDETLTIGCYLYDIGLKSEMVRKGFVVGPRDWRRAAHK